MSDLVQTVDKTIGAAAEVAIAMAEASIIAAQPWLGTPVLKQVWTFIAEKYAHQVILSFMGATNNVIIDFGNEEKNQAAVDAKNELQSVLEQPEVDSQAKKKAKDDFKKKYADLIRQRTATPMP